MCSLSGFELVWFLILQNIMEFMEVQYVLVMSLIRFFGSWAIVLRQSCFSIVFIKSSAYDMVWLVHDNSLN